MGNVTYNGEYICTLIHAYVYMCIYMGIGLKDISGRKSALTTFSIKLMKIVF